MSKYDTIVGLRSLMNKCTNISDKVANEYLLEAVKRGTLPVRNAAIMLVPVNHGELRQSIRRKHERTDDGVRGIIYTNKEYAPYVEFGTGPIGEENHEGISPHITPVYSQQGWLIPASEIDIADAARYGMFPYARITINGVDYYKTKGQPAQPFMYPALHDTEEEVVKRMGTYLAKKIKEEAGK